MIHDMQSPLASEKRNRMGKKKISSKKNFIFTRGGTSLFFFFTPFVAPPSKLHPPVTTLWKTTKPLDRQLLFSLSRLLAISFFSLSVPIRRFCCLSRLGQKFIGFLGPYYFVPISAPIRAFLLRPARRKLRIIDRLSYSSHLTPSHSPFSPVASSLSVIQHLYCDPSKAPSITKARRMALAASTGSAQRLSEIDECVGY